jgi:cyclopropane fatty-acyl-phospholipid synthase-like methyltransferase
VPSDSSVGDQYNEHARRCAPFDFWGQVKRTINGRAVGQDQIDMIVGAIVSGMELAQSDVVLDLGCGNGALSDRIFERCRGGVGVDVADYLIEVAQRHFGRAERAYVLDDVARYVMEVAETERFTRVLCYGAFQYFPPAIARSTLSVVRARFPNVTRVFLGNLPDRARMHNFSGEEPDGVVAHDHTSAIGIWRTQTEFAALAHDCGWDVAFACMPTAFFGAHYRYDAILRRRSSG